MEVEIQSCQIMSQMDYNFSNFYKIWALIAAIANVSGLMIALVYGTSVPWIVMSTIVFIYFIANIHKFIDRLPLVIGYANWISIFRLVIIVYFFLKYPSHNDLVLFITFLLVIILDGVDGFIARKFKQVSVVGGKLDMEIDAYLVLVLAWMHVDQKNYHLWVLIPGGMKYYYEIGFFWLKEKGVKYPPKLFRATIAVFFFLSLLTPFILNESFSLTIIGFSGILIILSFLLSLSVDIYNVIKKST